MARYHRRRCCRSIFAGEHLRLRCLCCPTTEISIQHEQVAEAFDDCVEEIGCGYGLPFVCWCLLMLLLFCGGGLVLTFCFFFFTRFIILFGRRIAHARSVQSTWTRGANVLFKNSVRKQRFTSVYQYVQSCYTLPLTFTSFETVFWYISLSVSKKFPI